MERLLRTDGSNSLLFTQRLVLALVIAPHGAQKLLGLFGGYGFSGTMHFFTDTMHLPALVAFLVICAESFGALLLALGLLTRVAAFGLSAVMVGAIVTTHVQHGFFMNWFGVQQGEGFEFHLLVLALSLPLLLLGAGSHSLDAWLLRTRAPFGSIAAAREGAAR